jgi:hypothetical protein
MTKTTKASTADAFIAGDGFFIIKDHAIRRAIIRSPIKDYEMALGMIMWAAFKAERIEHTAINVPDMTNALVQQDTTAARVIYSSFGKVVGTRFNSRTDRAFSMGMVLINTYLSNDMYVRGEYDE